MTRLLDIGSSIEIFKIALEQTADAVFITDPEGRIKYINQAFTSITGFTKEEALGKNPNIIKSGLHPRSFYKKLWTTISSGKSFRNVVINKKKNGELFYADHTVTPLKDNRGKIISYIATWKDITKQKTIDDQKKTFIALVGHELRTPITSIKTYVQLLRKEAAQKNNKSTALKLDNLDHQINRLISFINELIDVSEINGEKLKFAYEEFLFDDLINDVIRQMIVIDSLHPIILHGKTGKKVSADKKRLEEVLINFITNARKYSPINKRIDIELKIQGKYVVVMVQDYGVGIEKRYQKRIFRQFFRIETKSKSTIPGVGLGLYIASVIIKHHKGRIGVKSIPNKGSTFYFMLPYLHDNYSA